MNLFPLFGFIAGTSWASGLNTYLTVAMLGLLSRAGWAELPGNLKFCEHPAVIIVALVFYGVEFFADKIPWLDSGWDAVQTFIRVPAGAAIAALALGDHGPLAEGFAALAGGGIAFASHGSKATARAAINMSPEPFTNILASLAEDFFAAIGVSLAIWLPILMLVLVTVFVIAAAIFLPKIWRLVIKPFRRKRANAGFVDVEMVDRRHDDS